MFRQDETNWGNTRSFIQKWNMFKHKTVFKYSRPGPLLRSFYLWLRIQACASVYPVEQIRFQLCWCDMCCTGTAAAAQASVISAHLCFTLSFTVNELQSLSMFHVQEKDKAWKAKGCEYYMTAVYNCIRRRVSNTLCLHIISHYTLLMAETVKWLHIQ